MGKYLIALGTSGLQLWFRGSFFVEVDVKEKCSADGAGPKKLKSLGNGGPYTNTSGYANVSGTVSPYTVPDDQEIVYCTFRIESGCGNTNDHTKGGYNLRGSGWCFIYNPETDAIEKKVLFNGNGTHYFTQNEIDNIVSFQMSYVEDMRGASCPGCWSGIWLDIYAREKGWKTIE